MFYNQELVNKVRYFADTYGMSLKWIAKDAGVNYGTFRNFSIGLHTTDEHLDKIRNWVTKREKIEELLKANNLL